MFSIFPGIIPIFAPLAKTPYTEIRQIYFLPMATKSKNNNDVRVPPHNSDAEQSVLGSLMLDKDAIIRVADLVRTGDFYDNRHNDIFEAMLELYEEREPIDLLSLSNKLEERKLLERVGGASYLASLVNGVPSASNVAHYAGVVAKKATLRKLIATASDIAELGYDETRDAQLTLDEAEQKIFAISEKTSKKDFTPIKSILEEAFNRIDELHNAGDDMRGVPSCFPDLDNILAGFQKSDLVILAARPSIGKTTFALDIARNI